MDATSTCDVIDKVGWWVDHYLALFVGQGKFILGLAMVLTAGVLVVRWWPKRGARLPP